MAEPTRSDRQARSEIPRAALLGAAGIIALTLALASTHRLGNDRTALAIAEPSQVRELRFADLPQGGIGVFDFHEGTEIARYAPGQGGFVRGVMRGLARERKRSSIGMEPPFRLSRWSNGHMVLEDPATGRRIALQGFGATNAEAFAQLLGGAEDA
ncbi:MAG: photosynthetic complex assembly protein PuhC [Geminicoccaceae bacterium]